MMNNVTVFFQEIVLYECHETLVDVLWAIVGQHVDVGKVQEVSPGRLEAVMKTDELPDVWEACGVDDTAAADHWAVICNLP